MKSTLLHIPHASIHIPEQYISSFSALKLEHETALMTDWFCDELFDCGSDRIVFPISRLVCDVERFRDDRDEVMAKVGMGVTYTAASDLSKLRIVSEEERETILEDYYDPHHLSFTQAVDQRIDKYGKCLIIDCHSFYPAPLRYELSQNPVRPDFCLGTTEFHTPKAIANEISGFLSKKGFSVSINKPFKGTIVPIKHYGIDNRVSSIMIEVNRKLYLESPGVKSQGFPYIKALIGKCVEIAETFG